MVLAWPTQQMTRSRIMISECSQMGRDLYNKQDAIRMLTAWKEVNVN